MHHMQMGRVLLYFRKTLLDINSSIKVEVTAVFRPPKHNTDFVSSLSYTFSKRVRKTPST